MPTTSRYAIDVAVRRRSAAASLTLQRAERIALAVAGGRARAAARNGHCPWSTFRSAVPKGKPCPNRRLSSRIVVLEAELRRPMPRRFGILAERVRDCGKSIRKRAEIVGRCVLGRTGRSGNVSASTTQGVFQLVDVPRLLLSADRQGDPLSRRWRNCASEACRRLSEILAERAFDLLAGAGRDWIRRCVRRRRASSTAAAEAGNGRQRRGDSPSRAILATAGRSNAAEQFQELHRGSLARPRDMVLPRCGWRFAASSRFLDA